MELVTITNREQNEQNDIERDIDDEFLVSNTRLESSMDMRRVKCNCQNHLVFQRILIAIFLSTTAAICTLAFVSKNSMLAVNQCIYPGTCALPSDASTCGRCRAGFVKDPLDATRCKYAKSNASLIISSSDGIRMISLDSRQNTTQIIQNGGEIRGIDFNVQSDTIFWFSLSDKTIYKTELNASKSEKKIVMHDFSSEIYGIAVDWIYGHIYWVDERRHRLCVSNFNGTMKKLLYYSPHSIITSIAVNPLNGWMYWADESKNYVERAGMDGSLREIIFTTNNEFPKGLVVDFVDNRLYWSQGLIAISSSIWSSDFDGSDRKIVFTANSPQFSSSFIWKITTFDKYVYFIDWFRNAIYKFNKCNGKEIALIYKSKSSLSDIRIYDATLQPEGENFCLKRMSKCSHFCFPVPSSVNNRSISTTCACPDGLSISGDQRNCF